MSEGGPWVIAALFCKEVIAGEWSTTFIEQGNEAWIDKDEVPTDFVFTVIIAGGEPGQRVELRMTVDTPWGETLASPPTTYDMLGTTWTMQHVTKAPPFEVRETGTYWVRVYLDGEFKVASPFVFKRSPNL